MENFWIALYRGKLTPEESDPAKVENIILTEDITWKDVQKIQRLIFGHGTYMNYTWGKMSDTKLDSWRSFAIMRLGALNNG